MAKHRYTYHGTGTVHLPAFGITAEGGDTKTIHETDHAINHPDFQPVKEQTERKEQASSK